MAAPGSVELDEVVAFLDVFVKGRLLQCIQAIDWLVNNCIGRILQERERRGDIDEEQGFLIAMAHGHDSKHKREYVS